METMLIGVILVFFALVGLTNLILGLRDWLAQNGTLEGCTLVVALPEDAEVAEALLLRAEDQLRVDGAICGAELRVICPENSPARGIGELFCRDRQMPIAGDWQELGRSMQHP